MKNIASCTGLMLQAATGLTTLQKVGDGSSFLATCNATFFGIAICEIGYVLHGQLFLQLAMQCLLHCKLHEKLPYVTWP